MRELLIILFLVCIQSCNTGKLVTSKDCKVYYKFIKENWLKNDDSTFSFKGDPSYWNNHIYVKYIKDECLIGLDRKEIEKIFGSPTKHFKSPKFNVIVYCINELCLEKEFIYGGKLLRFDFDKNDLVKSVFTAPGASNIPDY